MVNLFQGETCLAYWHYIFPLIFSKVKLCFAEYLLHFIFHCKAIVATSFYFSGLQFDKDPHLYWDIACLGKVTFSTLLLLPKKCHDIMFCRTIQTLRFVLNVTGNLGKPFHFNSGIDSPLETAGYAYLNRLVARSSVLHHDKKIITQLTLLGNITTRLPFSIASLPWHK